MITSGLMITPGIGLLFWMTLTFAVLMFLLAKFAWRPILNALNERETSIVDALNQAKLAREEVQNLKIENERIIQEARIEKDNILKEAREIRDRIINDAKDVAKEEGDKMLEIARQAIEMEKTAVVQEMKNQISTLSLEIAEVILKQKLDNKEAQNNLIANFLENKNLN